MMVAPWVPLRGTLTRIDDGFRGTLQTLAAMRELVRQYRTDFQIRHAAASVLFLTPERMGDARPRALHEWVRDHVRYIPDVLDVETLATPVRTLQTLIGDCDDQATLLATLLESVGYPTRFVVAAYSQREQMEHVYLQVSIDGEWVDCDPTEPEPFGWAPPGALVTYIERV